MKPALSTWCITQGSAVAPPVTSQHSACFWLACSLYRRFLALPEVILVWKGVNKAFHNMRFCTSGKHGILHHILHYPRNCSILWLCRLQKAILRYAVIIPCHTIITSGSVCRWDQHLQPHCGAFRALRPCMPVWLAPLLEECGM